MSIYIQPKMRNIVSARRNPKDAGDLSSRHELLTEIYSNLHPGVADDAFALIQHSTLLYLVNVVNVSKELMYQQALYRLGNFSAIQLSEPAPLLELLTMALKDDESMSDVNEKERLEIAEVNTEIPKENAEMVNEYFSIHIDQDEDDIDQELLVEAEAAWAQCEWTIQHVLFPSMRLFLKPPKSMAADGTFVQVASLDKLHKILERC